MISIAEAEFLAPVFLTLLDDTLKKVAPKFESDVSRYLPSIEKLVPVLTQPNADAIKAGLLDLQYRAVEALVQAQLDKG